MNKKSNTDTVKAPNDIITESMDNEPNDRNNLFPKALLSFKIQAIIIAILAFVLYFNTLQNEMAFDDNIVIVRNEYVLQGIAGIPDILSKDGYESYYRQFNADNQLIGGRYRPLSLITFALEQQLMGPIDRDKVDSVIHHDFVPDMKGAYEQQLLHQMHVRHLMNILWFTLSVLVLLYFLRYVVFKNNPGIAFLACILFTIHPIHTEVVANVKSRDEIMSLLFISLTFISAFKYLELKKAAWLVAALGSLLLAFLSKEYAITLLVLLPLAFYLFGNRPLGKSLLGTLPYLCLSFLYLMFRFRIVPPMGVDADANILNNPYALAEGSQKLATEIATALNYLKLLFFPHPLTFDYSYNQIPYKTFADFRVWLSILVHGGLVLGVIYFLRKRSVLCFGLAFYLLNLLLICNIIFDIGATMGERLIYHSSLGFSICAAWLIFKGAELINPVKTGKIALASIMVILAVSCGYATIKRNPDWKNNNTLFTHDVAISQNSVLANVNVAISLMNSSDAEKDSIKRVDELKKSISLYNKALSIHPTYDKAYLNKSLAWFRMGIFDSVLSNLDKTRSLYPNHPQLPSIYYNLGIAFANSRRFDKSLVCWDITRKLVPNYPNIPEQILAVQNAMRELANKKADSLVRGK